MTPREELQLIAKQVDYSFKLLTGIHEDVDYDGHVADGWRRVRELAAGAFEAHARLLREVEAGERQSKQPEALPNVADEVALPPAHAAAADGVDAMETVEPDRQVLSKSRFDEAGNPILEDGFDRLTEGDINNNLDAAASVLLRGLQKGVK
jgi:hypothetical protein